MCCFENTYSGVFQRQSDRRVGFVNATIIEIIDKSFLACISAAEFSSIFREYLVPRLVNILVLTILYLSFAILHCFMPRGPQLLGLQTLVTTIAKIVLVYLLSTFLSATKVEGWNSVGFVTFALAAVILIKLCSVTVAYYGLVDMTGDWSYLIEFIFGCVLVGIAIIIELFLIADTPAVTAVVGAVLGTFLSTVSLLDLHQNMRVNHWWWREKISHGSIYHVIRQYTLIWCLRVEEEPRMISMLQDNYQEEQNVKNLRTLSVEKINGD